MVSIMIEEKKERIGGAKRWLDKKEGDQVRGAE